MTVKEIIKILFAWTPSSKECSGDRVVFGDDTIQVSKVCVCCIATCDVIRQAKKWGAQLIITHEPTFHDNCSLIDKVANDKKKLIEETAITIFRFHDHAHFCDSDKIIEGVLKKLNWKGSFNGIKKFSFDVEKSVDEIKNDMEFKLGLKNVRLTGCKTNVIKNISMCVGSWGDSYVMAELEKPEIDAVMCGEITEYSVCEYVRDAGQLGIEKTLFLLGHMGSEKCGMEFVCDFLSEKCSGVEFKYIDCGEVY